MPSSEDLNEKATGEIDQVEDGKGDHQAGVRVVGQGEPIDPVLERRTMRKVDLRLLPILGLLYSFSLIDRSNLGLAYVAGLARDLVLYVGDRYTIVIIAFFVPYILFELPANMVVRRVGPSLLLSVITVAWGSILVGMAYAPTWRTLAGLRSLLGFLEAGFFPSCAYLISTWYTRREMQLRLAAFWNIASLISGFSPIIAYGLSTLAGKNDLAGWSWIFLVEGIITIGLGLIAYPLIVDFPDKNKFLSAEETEIVKRRIDIDRGDAVYDPITIEKIKVYFLDLKIWALGILFCCTTVSTYAYSSFLPIILAGFGKSVAQSQLLATPPYIVAVTLSTILSYCADRFGHRYLFLIGQSLLSICGLLMTAYALDNNDARYAGVILGISGATVNIPTVLAYQSTNIVGQSKRSVSNAIVVAFGGVGGIISPLIMRSKDSPKYLPGLWANVGFQFLLITVVILLTIWFKYQNNLLKNGRRGPIENTVGFYYSL
ncbi:MFS general substrate transporter [Atractiella rhizophila]|nr:MFS general substrate transporter [Atractiella rhizophila]